MHLADKMTKHRLGDLKIRNHTLAHGADGHDAAGCLSQHIFRFHADSQHTVPGAAIRAYRDDGRFTQYNALPFDIDECICGPQIDGKIRLKKYPELNRKRNSWYLVIIYAKVCLFLFSKIPIYNRTMKTIKIIFLIQE